MTGPRDLADLNSPAVLDALPRRAEEIGASFERNDVGNARRLLHYQGRDLRLVGERARVWWRVWDGTRWRDASRADLISHAVSAVSQIYAESAYLDDDEHRKAHVAHAARSHQASALNNLLTVAEGLAAQTSPAAFDACPSALNVANGTLDVESGVMHAYARDDLLTSRCNTAYVPEASSARLDAFLDRFLPDHGERHTILGTLAVCALRAGNPERKLVLLLGPSSTGKSTLIDLLCASLGDDYACTVNASVYRSNLDDRARPDLLHAMNRRLAVSHEASDAWELHGDQVKRLTGGDALSARAMRSDVMVEKPAAFVPVIVANEVPRVKGADDAVRRRLNHVLVMDQVVSEADDDGREREALLADEEARQATVALLVRLYQQLDGRLPPVTERFALRAMQVFSELDDVAEALADLTGEGTLYQVDPNGVATHDMASTSEVYRCYRVWVRKHAMDRREALSNRAFTRRLESLGYHLSDARTGGYRRLIGWRIGDTGTSLEARF